LLLLLHLGYSTDHRSVHLDVSFSCKFRGISVPFYVFWIHKSSRLKKLMRMRQRVRKYHNILGPLEAIIIAGWAQSKDNITETLHELDVMDADVSRLGIIFLKC